MNIPKLKKDYQLKKQRIQARLKFFSYVMPKGNKAIFEELCFCILTPNTSAKMGINSISALKNVIYTASLQDIQNILKNSGYRYPNIRAKYLIKAREFIKTNLNFKLKEKIQSINNKEELRDYFKDNIKGIGYKESSHFLRNIGFREYCILDKHILNTLKEFKIINLNKPPKNKQEYLEIENKMKNFAKDININVDELDLLLWSRKTGEILK